MIKYAFHFLTLSLLIFNACSPQQKEIKKFGGDDIAIIKKNGIRLAGSRI